MDTIRPPQRLRLMMFLWRLSRSGGIPQVVRTVMQGLDRSQFELHLCSARPLLDEDGLDELGGDVELSTLALVGTPSAATRLGASFRLESLIRAWSPHIVHSHSGVGWYLVPWLTRNGRSSKTVLEIHDSPQSRRVSAVNNMVERLMIRRLGVAPLVHSSSVRGDLADWWGVPEERISTIPIGIDTKVFRPRTGDAPWRSSISISQDEIVVTYIARLVESKNPLLFLRAAEAVLARRPRVRFLLIGDGTDWSAIKASADSASLGDRFLMLRRVEDVRPFLESSDIFVSTSQYEGFGIAVLEAMASGLPVVATAAGGVQELVLSDENGFITPLDDLEPLVDAILTLVDDSTMRRAMGTRGCERARNLFDSAVMVRAYDQFYRHLVGPGDASGQRPR